MLCLDGTEIAMSIGVGLGTVVLAGGAAYAYRALRARRSSREPEVSFEAEDVEIGSFCRGESK